MKQILALLLALIVAATPAIAAPGWVKCYTVPPAPPARYLELGTARLAAGVARIEYVPFGQISRACGVPHDPKVRRYGCTLDAETRRGPTVHTDHWLVFVVSFLEPWCKRATLADETAHIGGYPAHHPRS